MNLTDKKVTVVGLGRSGIAACNLLLTKGAKVSVTDYQDNQNIKENARILNNKEKIINIQIGRHTEDLVQGQDLIVASPGVPRSSLPISYAQKKGIPVIGEIELAFAFCPAPIIAITGTNGKTTVATLVGQIFHRAQRKCIVCGNIGNPFSSEVTNITKDHVVILEISSFQLETINKFRPKVAVILNLAVDHLDRYTNFEQYFMAKCRIFSNQKRDDWTVLNADDRYSLIMSSKTQAKVLYFSKDNNWGKMFKSFNSNYAAALTISSLFAIPEDIAIDACRYFKGIAHRLERVIESKDIEFVNDSKATNVDSTIWALNSIKKSIILLAGGKDKGGNFNMVRDYIIRGHVRAIVLFGEAKEKIKKAVQDLVLIKVVSTLEQAVKQAFNLARPGDCILLSPMCASFDMFNDYTERGKAFKQTVYNLLKSKDQNVKITKKN
jgi:UDP-N-acetylmuramoylalanine--D-glutamate ligase